MSLFPEDPPRRASRIFPAGRHAAGSDNNFANAPRA